MQRDTITTPRIHPGSHPEVKSGSAPPEWTEPLQLEKTLERLQAITAQQQDQQHAVETIQGDQQRMNARLQTLEAKVQTLQQSGTRSTVDTEYGARKPAPSRSDHGRMGGRHPGGRDPQGSPANDQGPAR